MSPRNRPGSSWEAKAFAHFERLPKKVFLRTEFANILHKHADEWEAPRSLTPSRLITVLQKRGALRTIRLKLSRAIDAPDETPSENRKVLTRFGWGNTSPYSVGASLRSGAYLSHASAVFLHGLTDELPKTIYVNKEQSAKAFRSPVLTQDAIDRAFKNRQRRSTYIFDWDAYRFVLLSGKNTNRLEVSEIKTDDGSVVSVTKLERTLIDIVVRPLYAGGVFEVAKAYVAAKGRLSASTLIATLRKLEYVYPYHQAIGYYLERAGLEQKTLERFRALGLRHDFYLANDIASPQYVPQWRLWVPKDL
jgi:predicted transcriptional regulator of viral defense system